MPKRQRDYKAEYRRRNEKAKAEGWKSYSQKRTETKKFKQSREYKRFEKSLGGGKTSEAALVRMKARDPLTTKKEKQRLARHLYVDLLESVEPDDWDDSWYHA